MDNKSRHEQIVNEIMNKKYFSTNDVIHSIVHTKTVFIIANERKKKSGEIGRYYTVFPTFKDFLKNREEYKNCHEIFVDHVNNIPNLAGRLVFDFDIKNVKIPDNFKNQVEHTIVKVISKYFINVDINKFEYIWSTSENPTKISKHLTVKNLYFDNWMNLSSIFYKLFWLIWEKNYDWIQPKDLIDFQIVRKRASLRMVGSNKLGGHPLKFDNPGHKLTDSLIRIYFRNQRTSEQLVTQSNIKKIVSDILLDDDYSDMTEPFYKISACNSSEYLDPEYPTDVYEAAFGMYNQLQPDIFKMGKINGKIISMIRLEHEPIA